MDRHMRAGLKWALGLGLGIGLMAGAFGAALMPGPGLTDDQVRGRARILGMLEPSQLPPAPAPTPREAPPKPVVTYAISEGTSFGEIAAMLKQAGVVPDDQALIARARERDALEQVKAGIYTVTLDPAKPVTPDQVIDQLLKGSS